MIITKELIDTIDIEETRFVLAEYFENAGVKDVYEREIKQMSVEKVVSMAMEYVPDEIVYV